MKLWLDDIREPPDDSWRWFKTYDSAVCFLEECQRMSIPFEAASFDHDLGGLPGRDGINVLDWLVVNDFWPTKAIAVHSANPVGADAMARTIERYGEGYDRLPFTRKFIRT